MPQENASSGMGKRFPIPGKKRDSFDAAVGILRLVSHALEFAWLELHSSVPLPWSQTLSAWRRGFRRRSYRAYGLAGSRGEDFISDWTQSVRATAINGQYDPYINNKALFPLLMKALDLPHPRTLAEVGISRTSGPLRGGIEGSGKWVAKALSAGGLVLKPIKGCHGIGIFIVQALDEGCEINGTYSKVEDLKALLSQLKGYLVTELIRQHPYAAAVYPRTTNTIRLLTMWDWADNSPFVAAAAHRFGSERSYPVDNFKGGLGGLSSRIDLLTGELGLAVTLSRDQAGIQRFDRHPETGSKIAGLTLPGWNRLVDRILHSTRQLSFAPQLDWDIVLTEEGFSVLELNGCPGLVVHQVHGPLLSDPRVRRFYGEHGVL